jgi:hypothetical protein
MAPRSLHALDARSSKSREEFQMSAKSPAEAVVQAIIAAESHIRLEYSGDWDATLETVHEHACYALAQPGHSAVLSGHRAVSDHYRGLDGIVTPQASRIVAQVATDWYMFFENFPTRIDEASGEWRTVHTATLAPVVPPLIQGEMLWEREPGPLDPDPQASVRSVRIHERFLDAVRDGDAAALSSLIAPDAFWAERDYLSEAAEPGVLNLKDGAAAADYCRRWRAAFAPERVSILNRVATSWYVFAEELWVVAPGGAGGQRRQFRKATIYPISAAGTIRGAIGWGTELSPAEGAAADESVGRAFWERLVPGHGPDPLLRGRAR